MKLEPLPGRWFLVTEILYNLMLLWGEVSMVSPFPIDVVEYLATFLCDDFQTLQAYTLVCQSWNTIARPFLFRKITLKKVEQLLLLDSNLEAVPAMRIWIREIRILGFIFYERDDSSVPWICYFSTKLTTKLEHLHTIEIVSVQRYLDLSQYKTFLEGFSSLSSLKSLSFVDCVFSADVLLAFINTPPQLQDVHLHDIRVMSSMFVDQTDNATSPTFRSGCLRSLRIHSNDSSFIQPLPEFLKWFNGGQMTHTIQSVQIHIQSLSSLRDVGSFLKAVGLALHDLSLRFVGAQYWGPDRGNAGMPICAISE